MCFLHIAIIWFITVAILRFVLVCKPFSIALIDTYDNSQDKPNKKSKEILQKELNKILDNKLCGGRKTRNKEGE